MMIDLSGKVLVILHWGTKNIMTKCVPWASRVNEISSQWDFPQVTGSCFFSLVELQVKFDNWGSHCGHWDWCRCLKVKQTLAIHVMVKWSMTSFSQRYACFCDNRLQTVKHPGSLLTVKKEKGQLSMTCIISTMYLLLKTEAHG